MTLRKVVAALMASGAAFWLVTWAGGPVWAAVGFAYLAFEHGWDHAG